jgi:hypothetical protein
MMIRVLPMVGLVVGNTWAYSMKASDVFVDAGVVGVAVEVPVPVSVAVDVAVTVVVTVTVAVWVIFLQQGVVFYPFISIYQILE